MTVYSHSRISTYENCPFQYKLRYVDRAVPLLGNTIESYMGNIVHEALEWLYDTVVNHDLATKKELLAYYDRRWISKWRDDIRVIKTEFDFDYYKKWEYPVEKVAIIAEPTDDELKRIEDDLLDIIN